MEKWNWSEISTGKKVITVAVATTVAVVGTWVCFFGPLSSKGLEKDLAELKSDNERITSDFCANNRGYEVCEGTEQASLKQLTDAQAQVIQQQANEQAQQAMAAEKMRKAFEAQVQAQNKALEDLQDAAAAAEQALINNGSKAARTLVVEWKVDHCTPLPADRAQGIETLTAHHGTVVNGNYPQWYVDADANLHWFVNLDTNTVTPAEYVTPTDYRAVVAFEGC